MLDWGARFIELYTKDEQDSLQELVDRLFQQNMLIELDPDLLAEICRIWWMVLGSFGNTVLFEFVKNKTDMNEEVCKEAGINHAAYMNAIMQLDNNNVGDLLKQQEIQRFTIFLFLNLVNIFIYITGASTDELPIKEQPDPRLLQEFLERSFSIMDKGDETWRIALRVGFDDAIKHPEKYA